MSDNAIGVFDSGLGGLTSVREILRVLPNEDIIYFGDTKNAPYGSKTSEEIIELANKNIKFLKSKNVKIILAACGTVSSYLENVDCDIPIVGIISPTCKEAIEVTINKKIGVMATTTAIASKSYEKCINNIDKSTYVYSQPCEKLAGLIEKGHISINDSELNEAIKIYTRIINDNDVDTLILGCTHYPLVINAIIKHLKNKNINIINAGAEAVNELKLKMEENDLFCSKIRSGVVKYYVSGDLKKFKKLSASIFNLR